MSHHLGRNKRRLYDNAMAESIIGPYKTELIIAQRPWRTDADVELATLS